MDRSTTLEALAGSYTQPPTFVDQIPRSATSLNLTFDNIVEETEFSESPRATLQLTTVAKPCERLHRRFAN